MELYSLKSTTTPGQFQITKFDKNLEVESNYLVSNNECACPRGDRPTCRHRAMLSLFRQHKHINDGWFLDFHTRKWYPPTENADYAPEVEQPMEAEEVSSPASVAPAHSPAVPASGAPKKPSWIV
jgi:hypothetical protein